MCGIAGIVRQTALPQASAISAVKRMTAHMHRRGPDADATWAGDEAVLGHRRLSIIDLAIRANQPMVSPDGRYVVVFNGEIYNYRELRRELEADGEDFATTSDTEVLLRLFAREGERMLPRLRGMFAFGVWDTEVRTLFLARDPYGIKPLYYANTKSGFVFASQVKALRASQLTTTEPELAGLAGFHLWGSVPEPWTLYRDMFALPAGHWMRVRDGVADRPVSWYDIRACWRSEPSQLCLPDLKDLVREAMTDTVRAHLVADVPVGVFLSGGVDSGAIAGLAAQMGTRTEGITIAFEEFAGSRDDETAGARKIAAHYNLPHHVRVVSREEFERDVPAILDAMDQPSIDGVNTWFASKAASERGYKVVLSGIGGDELLCGYPSFHRVPRLAAVGGVLSRLPGARGLLGASCAWLARHGLHPKLAALPTFMQSVEGAYFLQRALYLPGELPGLMGTEAARVGLARLGGSPPGVESVHARNGVAMVGLLESTLYLRNQLLRDSDWASMGHSLELRTPFVDVKLLESLAPHVSSLAQGVGKRLLASAPTRSIPSEVVDCPKTGFGIPMATWLAAIDHQQPTHSIRSRGISAKTWGRGWAQRIFDQLSAIKKTDVRRAGLDQNN